MEFYLKKAKHNIDIYNNLTEIQNFYTECKKQNT